MLSQHDRDAIETARKALGRQLALLRQAAGYSHPARMIAAIPVLTAQVASRFG